MALLRNGFGVVSRRALHLSSIYQQNNLIWSPPTSVTIYKRKSIDFLKTKLTDAVSWYEEFTGLRELREAQCRVLIATEMLKEAQDRRRESRIPLAESQKKLQQFQPELRNMPRDDDRYITLIQEEHALLKELKFLQQRLQEAESDEREAFEQLSTSLRVSHEAERVQAERTKYWSILATILGTTIGIIGSSINNSYKMKQLKALVFEHSENNDMHVVKSSLEQLNLSVKNNLDINEEKLKRALKSSYVGMNDVEKKEIYIYAAAVAVVVTVIINRLF